MSISVLRALVAPIVQLAMLVSATSGDDPPYDPPIAAASDEAQKAIARFRVPQGLKVELFAAEPLLAHPVAIAPDEQNRWYVAETFRHSDGVTDTRGHMNWLVEDLGSRSVADRVAMYKKHFSPEEFAKYGVQHERVRRIEDRDGDGVADHATVFADGFNSPETGLGAGVLARRGEVYFTCIPDLWKLRDADGDGKADARESLHTGYGVRVQFIGHDLHGLIVGPDGRLYFTMGDRGLNVVTKEGKTLAWPDSGAVLRCELDGSNLEIIHVGLRNPQELAFDEFGNLFTVDNNSDGGDRARLVWVVPGGDSGWRAGYQYLENRGPWNAEKMWHPQTDAQPAFLVPALANFSDGPGGLAYNPGTALRPEDRGRFFLADFRGSSGDSGVRSFAVRPKGASFELVDEKQFVWGLEATDVAFGNDGALYISDWVEGWDKTGKGRIYRVRDLADAGPTKQRSTRSLIAEGMQTRQTDALFALLDDDDLRVRLDAQLELASRARAELEVLTKLSLTAAGPDQPPRARRHALWGLWHVERLRAEKGNALIELLKASEADIRLQSAKILADVLGSAPGRAGFDWIRDELKAALIQRLQDDEPPVRFHAAIALGNLGDPSTLTPLAALLAANNDADAYLRHAGVMGLAGIGRKNIETLLELASDPSPSVRMAVLLAFRRLKSPEIGRFLHDPDPRLVLEAARAIYDVPTEPAIAALADLPIDKNTRTPLLHRVIAARERRGTRADAASLGAFAIIDGITSAPRITAVDALANWAKPRDLDRVTGLYRPLAPRNAADAASVLSEIGAKLLAHDNDGVVQAACRAIAALSVRQFDATMTALAKNADRSSFTRIEALKALDALDAAELPSIVKLVVNDSNRGVRAEALAILARIDPAAALGILARVLQEGSTEEKQRAFATLGTMEGPQADGLIADWLGLLAKGDVPPALRLDLIEAAEKRSSNEVKGLLAKYQAGLPVDNPLAAFELALEGGRAQRGERIYRENAAVSCVKCHKVRGQGGEVGPELTGIAVKKDRRYLLESIVLPNHQIAEGFETTVLALKDGKIVSGIVKKADAASVTLIDAEARVQTIARDQIDEETRGQSAMPQELAQKLSRAELRDLIEYLSTLK